MHYTLIVVDRYNEGLDDLMAPFDDNLEVDEYLVEEVSEDAKQRMLDYYNHKQADRHLKVYETFEECYEEKGDAWNFGRWRKGEDGVWREYSTHNPNAEWDWYQVGGRWPGRIHLKEGVENVFGVGFSRSYDPKCRQQFIEDHPDYTDVALKKDIANLEEITSYAVLKDGEWIELDGKKVAPYLEDVDDKVLLYSVDCHM